MSIYLIKICFFLMLLFEIIHLYYIPKLKVLNQMNETLKGMSAEDKLKYINDNKTNIFNMTLKFILYVIIDIFYLFIALLTMVIAIYIKDIFLIVAMLIVNLEAISKYIIYKKRKKQFSQFIMDLDALFCILIYVFCICHLLGIFKI